MVLETKVEIGTSGIKHALRKYDTFKALAECVWNGFDANASTINIEYDANEMGFINELRIIDNGFGIPRQELNKKFKPIFHTEKTIDPDKIHQGPSAIHGKNGYGRLTFFKFAGIAEWITTYKTEDNGYKQYHISISADKLNSYSENEEKESSGPNGTTVRFVNIHEITSYDFNDIQAYLSQEFAWFLELGSPFTRNISINGEPLNYEFLIGERETEKIDLDGQSFSFRYIRWKEKLHSEYSRFYFIGSDNCERVKKTTLLNNKGDGFYHSMFVHGGYFDQYNYNMTLPDEDDDNAQLTLLTFSLEQDKTFQQLLVKLDEYLRKKRTPFLKKHAQRFVRELEEDNLFPPFSSDPWDQYRKQELSEVLREVYEVDPRIFNGLTNQQKMTIVQLFCLIIASSERDNLLEVLAQVVNLNSQERAELATILHATQLSNVIATIKLIEDRYTAIDELKMLVFQKDFGANERDHLQTHIERHFWLFGEQYHIVTKAEPKFEEALRRFMHLLYGENKPRVINHPDKNKEMDIFAVCCVPGIDKINNVVVELKHPSIKLGEKELSQVKKYMSVILDQPEFNASNMTWIFYLVGNKYDNYIALEFENNKSHGEPHLAFKVNNYKIFILNWSEVIANFEMRHNFLLEKLKLEREKLASVATSADEILTQGNLNSAAAPNEDFNGAMIQKKL